jgi:cyclopropane-fatty-acyl-phospholipid synthase
MVNASIETRPGWVHRIGGKPAADVARRLVLKLLSKLETGSIRIVDGRHIDVFGRTSPEFPDVVTVRIRRHQAYAAIVWGGSVGAAEAYILQFWDADDVTALVRLVIRNQMMFRDLDRGSSRLAAPLYKFFHFLRRNTPSGSRKNIVAHYDLGNDFYRLFLDETMTYSSGIFEGPDTTLKEASIAKYDRICRKLKLSGSDHVLEIGTGWGGFTLHAVKHYGCRMTTTTISDEQYALARERFSRYGISDRVTLLKSDYRELRGHYDKLVSIEMIEAVGHQYLDLFMAQCSDLLKPDGKMVLQAITIADWAFDQHKKEVDFIKRYIFPGSCIPSIAAISDAVAKATDLRLFHLEDITPHYAETLRRWRKNFMSNIDRIKDLNFSEAFLRMWEYYLRYCEAGFQERYLGSVQMVLNKPLSHQRH